MLLLVVLLQKPTTETTVAVYLSPHLSFTEQEVVLDVQETMCPLFPTKLAV